VGDYSAFKDKKFVDYGSCGGGEGTSEILWARRRGLTIIWKY
jgi:hypothetical protein